MMLRRLALSVAMGLVLTNSAFAADGLNDAMAKAYQNNPDLSAARAELRGTNELAPQALSNYRPTIEADASIGAITRDNETTGTEDYVSESAALTITEPLYRGGRTMAAVRQADSSIAAGEAALHDTEQAVLIAAVQSYLDVVRDQAVVELNKNNESVLTRHLKATKDRFSVGEVTKTDVSQAESRISGAKSSRVQAEGNLTQSRATYERIIGEQPAGTLENPKVTLELPKSREDVIREAEASNPLYKNAAYIKDAANAALDGVKGERLPTVQLQGQLAHSDDNRDLSAGQVDSASAVVSMSWPLYAAGSTSSRIRQARQTVAQQSDLVESARRTVVERATQAWEQLETARSVIDSRKAQVKAARVALEGVEQEAVVGSRTVLDTLDAEQELLNAEVGLVQAERDQILAQYQVLSAVGRLTARSLALPVEYYDEKAYAKKVRHKFIGSSGE